MPMACLAEASPPGVASVSRLHAVASPATMTTVAATATVRELVSFMSHTLFAWSRCGCGVGGSGGWSEVYGDRTSEDLALCWRVRECADGNKTSHRMNLKRNTRMGRLTSGLSIDISRVYGT